MHSPGLDNLQLLRLPIEELPGLHRDFDLVIFTGVLHQLQDPDRGLAALRDCLRADGVIALMLYARHGRQALERMQSVFMTPEQTRTKLASRLCTRR